MADDRGSAPGVRSGDLADCQRYAADPQLTAVQAFSGQFSLVVVFLLITWSVVAYRGISPEVMSGVYVGTFLGLLSLVAEMALIGRSMRLFQHNGMQATLQTFTLRLVIVGTLGIWLMRPASATDAQAFCLSYCGTFFVYLCWLTWRTYNAPVQYQGRKAAVGTVSATTTRVSNSRVAVGSVGR